MAFQVHWCTGNRKDLTNQIVATSVRYRRRTKGSVDEILQLFEKELVRWSTSKC